MNTEQILQADHDELGKIAAELFTEKPWKHDIAANISGPIGTLYYCAKCNDCVDPRNPCPIPDPLDVTNWNVAMRLRDEVLEEFGETKFDNAKCIAMGMWSTDCMPTEVRHKLEGWHTADSHFANDATPQDYIKAACITKSTAK